MRRNEEFLPARRGRESGSSPWSEEGLYGPSSVFGGSPWQIMRRMHEDMDRIFGQLFEGGGAARSGQQAGMQVWAPSVDVSQTNQEWCIEVDLPGVKEENVDVELRDNHLILRAQMRQEASEGAPTGTEREDRQAQEQARQPRQYFHRERRYGYFERVLPLPENVDEQNISCNFENGVLTIHLPKAEQAREQSRRIPVSTGRGRTQEGNGRGERREPAIAGTKGGEAGAQQQEGGTPAEESGGKRSRQRS